MKTEYENEFHTIRFTDVRHAEHYVMACDRLLASGYTFDDEFNEMLERLRKKIAEFKGEIEPVNS